MLQWLLKKVSITMNIVMILTIPEQLMIGLTVVGIRNADASAARVLTYLRNPVGCDVGCDDGCDVG